VRPRRAITLIELLIVVAIIAILSSGLVFSTSQIITRSVRTERTQLLEESLSIALDAITADVAQSTAHGIAPDGALTLTQAAASGERRVDYRLELGNLLRRIGTGDHAIEWVLVGESASGEFADAGDGLKIALTGRFAMPPRVIERRVAAFVAWPEAVGCEPPDSPPPFPKGKGEKVASP
jgi:prepilin-type N-terminal cleavage/methylation domain-containing protein